MPVAVTDEEIIHLNDVGVRAIRFNLYRGGSASIQHLSSIAAKIYELVGWHIELYVDSADLSELYDTLIRLPAVSIDHLALNKVGFKLLLNLVEQGIRVKASGFGRVNFNVKLALQTLYKANPHALMFGTDLPSTRATKPYSDDDFLLVLDALDTKAAEAVFSQNAIDFYNPLKVT